MTLTAGDVMTYLYILVAVMLIVVLYHLMFIAVDMRKMMKRFDDITEQVETVILKPVAMADTVLEWVKDYFEQKGKKKHVEHRRK